MAIVQFGEKLESSAYSIYTTFKFEEVGDSITMLVTETGSGESKYGKFKTLCGVSFNADAQNIQEAIGSIQLHSFVMSTVISNLFDSGKLCIGSVYNFKFHSERGTKYTDKHGKEKKTESNHFEVCEVLNLPEELKTALQERVETIPTNEGLGLSTSAPLTENNTQLDMLAPAPKKPRL